MPEVNLPSGFPNFLGIGASKSGTSSLYTYLRQHPQVFLPETKETHYFTFSEIYELGPRGFADRYYRYADAYPAVGDITPTYFIASQLVIPRIRKNYGDKIPRFILILRDPVERAWSHYLHKTRTGEESESFEDALVLEKERIVREPYGWWGYVSEGRYAFHLRPWLEAFPRENFLFLLTEDLAADPLALLRKIYRFLGVDPDYVIPDLRRQNTAGAAKSVRLLKLLNSPSPLKSAAKRILPFRYRQRLKTRIIELNTSRRAAPPKMSMDLRKELIGFFKADTAELEALTGLDLLRWKEAPADE